MCLDVRLTKGGFVMANVHLARFGITMETDEHFWVCYEGVLEDTN